MKFSVTLTIVILFCVVLGAYIYLTPASEENQSRTDSHSARLFDLAAGDEIQEIIINSAAGNNLVIGKKEKVWQIQKPFDYPADPLVVEGLISALRLTPKEGESKPESEWEEYGLAAPELKVGIRTRRSDTVKFLFFGDKSPVADRIYARWEGGETYFLLDEQIKNIFTSSLYSFRQKKVFRTPLKAITKIRFQSGLDAYEIIQGLSGWVWMEPVTFLGTDVAPETADQMLALIQNTYIKDFLEKGSSVETGLSSPADSDVSLQIKVWTDTLKEPEVLYLGSEIPEKDAFYGRRSDEETVFIVARGHIMRLFELLSAEAGKVSGASAADSNNLFKPASGV